jgi:hypothetical protein
MLPVAESAAAPHGSATAVSPAASSATELVASADGLTLSVSLNGSSVRSGDSLDVTATVTNGSASAIDYAVPWCGGAAKGYVDVALPQGPVGRTWSGIAGTFKQYVLTEGYAPGAARALDPMRVDLWTRPCQEVTGELEIRPGETITSVLSWPAEIVQGVRALPGPVPFAVSVSYDRQNGPPSLAPDHEGPPPGWFPEYKQLEVTGTVQVVGDAPALAGPGEVIDSLLDDTNFAEWLAEQPRSTWSNANLFLNSSSEAHGIVPEGPSWEVDLYREIGVPRHWAIAFVDPFDALLRSLTYCDVPCDR